MGVIWQDLGALTTVRARELSLVTPRCGECFRPPQLMLPYSVTFCSNW